MYKYDNFNTKKLTASQFTLITGEIATKLRKSSSPLTSEVLPEISSLQKMPFLFFLFGILSVTEKN